jgi:hypothetical protein
VRRGTQREQERNVESTSGKSSVTADPFVEWCRVVPDVPVEHMEADRLMNKTEKDDGPFVNETIYWPIRWLGSVDAFLKQHTGKALVKLNRKKIASLIEVAPIHPAFGDQALFQRMIDVFFEGFAANPGISAMGVLGMMEWATSCFGARKECIEYVEAHPEVLAQRIEKPIVVMGMHRTGSTTLFNLLHQDDRTRSPFMYEMYGDWPHIPSALSRAAHFTDPRMMKLKKLFDQGVKFLPEGAAKRNKSHESSYDMIEEEYVITTHVMNWFAHKPLVGDEFKELLFDENKDFVFQYLKIYLQMLQTGYAPSSHWTLKAPSHLLHIDSFMRVFSDARVVLLHRDPAATIPSMCYLIEGVFGCYWHKNTWDRRTLGPYALELCRTMTQRLMKYRDNHPEKASQFLDIQFADLVADPLGQAKHIYETFGITGDESIWKKMQTHLAQEKNHKHGKPDYSLEKYGLTQEEVRSAFVEYTERYLTTK